MEQETLVDDPKTGRKCYLHLPSDLSDSEVVTFILNLHGGGSVGAWQHEILPRLRLRRRLSAGHRDPNGRHQRAFPPLGGRGRRSVPRGSGRGGGRALRRTEHPFPLAGRPLAGRDDLQPAAVDEPVFRRSRGRLVEPLGGRLGLAAEHAADAGPPRSEAERARMEEVFARRRIFEPPSPPTADFSFIYATGEHEIASLPETSPWAERYGAEARVRIADVVDTQPGKIHDGRFDQNPTKSWGRKPAPGTAQVYVFPNAKGGRVIADVVRIDKGHTEGLEPRITEEIIKLMVSASGGKFQTGGTRLDANSGAWMTAAFSITPVGSLDNGSLDVCARSLPASWDTPSLLHTWTWRREQ